MNKIYSLVWNRRQGKFVVAQENAASRGRGKRASTGAGKRAQHAVTAALALAATLLAAPVMATNYTVTSNTDNGTISTPGTLSWAIDQANTGSGNTITLLTNVEVTRTLPTITQPITITANSAVQIYGGTLVLGNGTAGSVSFGNNVRIVGADGNSNGSTNYNGGNAVSGSGFALANSGTIIAGNGDIDSGGVGVGIGGSGGNGVSGSGFTLTNFGTITAGNGASGGPGGSSDNGGDSGNGGNGVSGSGFTLTNSGTINGGRGARGGAGGTSGLPGSAGNGGNGVSGSGFTLTNSGTINGGGGGGGGLTNVGTGGAGGSGGNGVSGSGFTLTNSGSINGGNGGNGGAGAGSGGSNTVGSAAVVSTGNATIYNSGTIAGGTGRGLTANAVTLSGGGNKLVLQVGGQFTSNVVSAGGDTFALGGASGSGSFALSDIGATAKYQGFSAFTKQDAGTWTLTGSGTSSWTVQGGTLVLADSMSLTGTLAVQSGGTVTANNATVSGAVNNAGTFGVSAGKTVHTGAYTNASGGTLRIGVSGMSSYGKLVVNGTATLGGTLFVDAASASGISAGSLSQVISATTISGTFATTSTNSLLFTYTPSYVGNQVNLLVAAAPSSGGSSSGGSGGTTIFKTAMEQGNFPGSGAAKALDQIIGANPNGAIGSLFQGFITGQQRQLSNAVSQTLPLLVGGSQVAVNSAFSGVNRVVQSRIDGNRGLSSGDEFLGDRNVWFKPFGSWANQGDRNGVSGFNASTYGVVAGVDRPFSEQARAGVALAYARSTVDGNSSVAPQSSKVDVYQLIGYGSYSLDQDTELNLQGDIARNSNRGKRSIAFASSVAEGAYDSTGVHAGVGLARSFALSPATTFTPSVRADYTWIRDAGYTESGAGALNLNVDSRSASQFLLSTDGKLNLQLNPNTNLAFNAGVGYDTINKQASITSAYAGAPGVSFATYGLEQSPWIGRVGAALTTTTSGVSLSLRYDLEARSSFTNQTASAKARWSF